MYPLLLIAVCRAGQHVARLAALYLRAFEECIVVWYWPFSAFYARRCAATNWALFCSAYQKEKSSHFER